MDHVRLDATRRKPARQREAVAAGFEGQRNPRDIAAGLDPLSPPATPITSVSAIWLFEAGAGEREGRRKAAPDGSPTPRSRGSANREAAHLYEATDSLCARRGSRCVTGRRSIEAGYGDDQLWSRDLSRIELDARSRGDAAAA
jgi:hypothetical protein